MNGFQTAQRRLADVDPTHALVQIADTKSRRADCRDAIEQGRSRQREMSRRLAEVRDGMVADPDQAADAMLAGDVIDMIDVETIATERRAVEIGLRELHGREAALRREEFDHKQAAERLLTAASMPALEPLRDMAAEGMRLIAEAYAGATAVAQASANMSAAEFAEQLRDIVAHAAAGQHIDRRKPIPVPPPVLDALHAGHAVIAALDRQILSAVPVPDVPLNMPLLKLISSALAD